MKFSLKDLDTQYCLLAFLGILVTAPIYGVVPLVYALILLCAWLLRIYIKQLPKPVSYILVLFLICVPAVIIGIGSLLGIFIGISYLLGVYGIINGQAWVTILVDIVGLVAIVFAVRFARQVSPVSLILIAFLTPLTIIAMFFAMESYMPFYPEIDTQFTQGFSWENFNKVTVGMTEGEVRTLLGKPYENTPMGDTYISVEEKVPNRSEYPSHCWAYSQDGKFKFWDFAWNRVQVCFDEQGIVEYKDTQFWYD
jgi:hypothetical protein